jgi:hypothetical protein
MRRIAIVVLILMLATAAHAGEIFRYVTSDGTVSFTDDVKRIPAAYKDVAETVVLEGEFKEFGRLSVITVDPTDLTSLVATKLVNRDFHRAFVSTCDGHISVTSERVQFGDFNRTVYYVYDECGKLVSTTFSQPEVYIGR